jgi:hypothetical protein
MIRPVLLRVMSCLASCLALSAGVTRADDTVVPPPLPLSSPTSLSGYEGTVQQPLTIAQQRARYEADQRMLRMQWNKWIGYEPLRPSQPNVLMNNEMNPHYMQPVRYRPVWGVWNYGSRIW